MSRQLGVGIVLTVISAFGFGSGALFAKPVYATGVDWFTLMTWRFSVGAALSWAWVASTPRGRAAVRALDRRAIAVSVALGILYTGNSSTYFAGLETVSASLAALIVYLYPAIVAVLSLRIGRRLEGRRAWGALGLALVGVVLAIGAIDAAHLPPTSGLPAHGRLPDHLLGLDRALGAAGGRAPERRGLVGYAQAWTRPRPGP